MTQKLTLQTRRVITDALVLPRDAAELLDTASSLTSLSPDHLVNSCLARLLAPSPTEQLRDEIEASKIYFK